MTSATDIITVPAPSFTSMTVGGGGGVGRIHQQTGGGGVTASSPPPAMNVVVADPNPHPPIHDEYPPLDAKFLNKVHEELEKLNICTDLINRLELQLDEARKVFRRIQNSWSQRLEQLAKKYGSAIDKGRPYYEEKLKERRLREAAQTAAMKFERANSMHAVAKQQVKLTQDSLNRQKTIEPECLEVLNHHIQRVNECEAERLACEEAHRQVSAKMLECSTLIRQMEKENGRAIKKSRLYFDQRVEFTRVLEQQKQLILRLEMEVQVKKDDYNRSLNLLESISNAVHEERSIAGMKREAGVGCERPEPTRQERARAGRDSLTKLPQPVDIAVSKTISSSDVELTLPIEEEEIPIDPSIFDDEPSSNESDTTKKGSLGRRSRPASLGSGVILLAQQLIAGARNSAGSLHSAPIEEQHRARAELAFTFPAEDMDFRYHTQPEGVCPLPSTIQTPSTPPLGSDSGSEASSLSSARGLVITEVEDDRLSGMLRSHSQMINEIDECADHVGRLIRRSVSDMERQSASGESESSS